jgi:hypothetical protein
MTAVRIMQYARGLMDGIPLFWVVIEWFVDLRLSLMQGRKERGGVVR